MNYTNNMKATVSVIGYWEDFLPSSVVVQRYSTNELGATYEIVRKYEGASADIDFLVANNGDATLWGWMTIRPSNTMLGTVAVLPPPFYIRDNEPVKDATLRQSTPTFNYGGAEELVIGATPTGLYRSAVAFDISNIPDKAEIEYSKIRMPLRFPTRTPFRVAVYTSTGAWTETSVHWNSQPRASQLIGTTSVYPVDNVYELDVTSFIKSMHSAGLESVELVFKALNESYMGTMSFGSKESVNPVTINTGYYVVPDSGGAWDLAGSVNVAAPAYADLAGELDIVGGIYRSTLSAALEVPGYEGTLDLEASITALQVGYSDLVSGSLSIEKKQGELLLNALVRPALPGTLDVGGGLEIEKKYLDGYVEGSITPNVYGEGYIEGSLTYEVIETEATLSGEITAMQGYSTYLDGSLEYNAVETEATLSGEIIAMQYGEPCLDGSLIYEAIETEAVLSGEITAMQEGRDYVPGELSISFDEGDGMLDADFTVAVGVENYLEGSLTYEVIEVESYVDGSITPAAYSEGYLEGSLEYAEAEAQAVLDGEITVRAIGKDYLEASITSYTVRTISASIDVRGAAYLSGVVRVISDQIDGKITVKHTVAKYLSAQVIPRIFWANDLDASLVLLEYKYLDGHCGVGYGKDLDAELYILNAGSYAYIM